MSKHEILPPLVLDPRVAAAVERACAEYIARQEAKK
jgi:hypothetical protein